MDISQLRDYYPAQSNLPLPLPALLREYEQQPPLPRIPCEKEQFLCLLAALPALRKVPGLPPLKEGDPAAFITLPACPTPAHADTCRHHLRAVANITDRQSLLTFCNQDLRCQTYYLDFEAFWEGRPPFDPAEMSPPERKNLELFRDFAAQFYPLVGRHGFLAWDISECTGYLLLARACGILTHEEAMELGDYWVAQAQTFRSWHEYAVSLLAGQLFWNLLHRATPNELLEEEKLFLSLVRMLLQNPDAWQSARWYAPPQDKPYAIPAPDIRPLLRDWEGPAGCFATDQVTVLNLGVGFCYREEPEGDQFPDSGWRFFSGQEDQDYLDDPKNSGVFHLNTIANYDPEILAVIDAPYGSAFGRGPDGKLHPEPFPGAR